MPTWADDVAVVPLRRIPPKEFARISRERGLGFDADDLRRLRSYFRSEGRDPTDVELAGIAQSWSEHCSYKSTRPFLRRAFGPLRSDPRVLGTGDAGVMAFEDGQAYALRIESHNHPSAVEPYGGAATGIGGILRDVLAVGAKPVALTDPLFFGPLDAPRRSVPSGLRAPRYLAEGVIAGIRDYGNRVGVPTVSGGVYFDAAYTVNPLVNVGCVGVLPRDRLRPNAATGLGHRLILVGGLTGRDGIGGVAFASKELTDRSGSESRGAVQLGNPIMKEPLIHACLEVFDRRLVGGVKDLGGGGLASASGELVFAGGFGSRIELDRVPLRESGLKPWEIWISESQERMLLDVEPHHVEELLTVFRRFDLPATDIGGVTKGPYEELYWHAAPAARLRVPFRVDRPPLRRRAVRSARRRGTAPRVPDSGLRTLVEELVLAPDALSREAIVRVYDHEVQGRTVVKPLHGGVATSSHGDAAVIQPRSTSPRGLAIATAAQPWACREDPAQGARMVVEEAARNLYAVGARPDAFSNCLNFGNPEDPRVLADFAATTQGLADAARALGFAVPSGNVSLYNGGLGSAIPPTPVLLATGIVEDIGRATTSDLKGAGDALYVLGRSRPELGGSLWSRRHGRSGGTVPPSDARGLRKLGEALLRAGPDRLVRAVHDVSDGGLAVCLCEMAFGGRLGFDVDLAGTGLSGPGVALAAEGASRFVVEVPSDRADRFEAAMEGVPIAPLGSVAPEFGALRWEGKTLATIDLRALYSNWRTGLGLP
jgi:phosphoribosylformylglycinamidine synthase subunit PurL